MVERNKYLKIKAVKRDNFTCQKCKIQDKTGEKLEAHHIVPLYFGGKDNLDNIITLCFDCHHYAPDKPEEFKEYMGEEMEGILTQLMKAWKKTREEHPELFKEDSFPKTGEENKIISKMDNSEIEALRKENEELKKELEKLKSLRVNQKKGMAEKAKKGNPVSRVAFGYKMINGNLVPAENHKEVEEIFEEFLNNKISLTQLAKKHNLSVNGLKKILANFTYISKIKFDSQVFDGNHPPLISSTLFNHVQNKLEKLGIKPNS
jgi:hypothetical protein